MSRAIACHRPARPRARARGAALLLTFFMMLILTGVGVAVAVFAQNSLLSGRGQLLDKQAYYIAEAGWQRARQALSVGTWRAAPSAGNTYNTTNGDPAFGAGEYQVTLVDATTPAVENGDTNYTITAEGYVPNRTTPAAKRKETETTIDVTVANTNLSLAGTATASSTSGTNTASKANDGSTGTKWQAGTKGPNEWLKLDLGSAKTVDRILIKDDGNIHATITLAYSDDNASWTTVSGTTTVESPNNSFTITFAPTVHRYLRASFPDVSSGDKVGIKEWENYDTSKRTVTYNDPGSVTTQW